MSTPRSRRSSVSSSNTPSHVQFMARKRIIYAHSDILCRRSQYFAAMLTSSFSENSTSAPGGRRTYTVHVEEADFVTIFWLLKWVYANWLQFRSEDDPKAAVEGSGTGWSAKWLATTANATEWDWKAVVKPVIPVDGAASREELESATSADGGSSPRNTNATERGSKGRHDPSSISGTSTAASAESSSSKTTLRPSQIAPSTRSPGQSSNSATRRSASSSTPGRQISMEPLSSGSSRAVVAPTIVSPTTNVYHTVPVASRRSRSSGSPRTPDPHPHPVQTPCPASALSMYQIAHRYAMPGLACLALEHIMNTITPKSSFPLLLATSVWDELHGLVEVCV